MFFTANADNFREAFNLVKKVVDSRATMPIMRNVLIDAQPGRVLLCATDLETTLCVEVLGCEVKQPGKGLIYPALMKEVVKALKDGEVDVKSTSDGRVTIGGAPVTNPEAKDPLEYPALKYDTDSDTVVTVKTPDFAYALSFARPAASTDPNKPLLACVYLDYTPDAEYPGTLTLVATDGHRLNRCSVRGAAPAGTRETGILFPKEACEVLLNVLTGEETTFRVDGAFVYLHTPAKGDRSAIYCVVRRMDSSFPNFRRVIPDLKTVKGPKFSPVSLSDLSEAAIVTTKTEKVAAKALDIQERFSQIKIVGIEGKEGFGFISVNAKKLLSKGETETIAFIPCPQIQPGEILAAYYPTYWTDLAKVTREDKALVSIPDSLSPTVIVPDTHLPDVSILSIIMPQRFKEEKKEEEEEA